MTAGRPPKYKDKEELQSKVDEYFDQEDVKITISGLCHYLGFESRQSFYDLQKNETFSYTIKRARNRIEQYYEEHLLERNATGAIFALKNFGWSDKQEIESTNFTYTASVTKEEVKDISEELENEC